MLSMDWNLLIPLRPGKTEKKEDWFYWVNGILAPVGVAEYRPQAGDEIWWDYHDWNMTMFVPAVIGSYPHPFIGPLFFVDWKHYYTYRRIRWQRKC
ncbi:MAG: DUF4430 domain-containing protein [Thermotaleaceae bacterium]